MIPIHRQIDSRFAVVALVLVIAVVGALAWWRFAAPNGSLTAAQAGLGKPMHPGEIPGGRAAVSAPTIDPSANR